MHIPVGAKLSESASESIAMAATISMCVDIFDVDGPPRMREGHQQETSSGVGCRCCWWAGGEGGGDASGGRAPMLQCHGTARGTVSAREGRDFCSTLSSGLSSGTGDHEWRAAAAVPLPTPVGIRWVHRWEFNRFHIDIGPRRRGGIWKSGHFQGVVAVSMCGDVHAPTCRRAGVSKRVLQSMCCNRCVDACAAGQLYRGFKGKRCSKFSCSAGENQEQLLGHGPRGNCAAFHKPERQAPNPATRNPAGENQWLPGRPTSSCRFQ